MFCDQCGAKMPDGSKFCARCGKPMVQQPLDRQAFTERPQQSAFTERPQGQFTNPNTGRESGTTRQNGQYGNDTGRYYQGDIMGGSYTYEDSAKKGSPAVFVMLCLLIFLLTGGIAWQTMQIISVNSNLEKYEEHTVVTLKEDN